MFNIVKTFKKTTEDFTVLQTLRRHLILLLFSISYVSSWLAPCPVMIMIMFNNCAVANKSFEMNVLSYWEGYR